MQRGEWRSAAEAWVHLGETGRAADAWLRIARASIKLEDRLDALVHVDELVAADDPRWAQARKERAEIVLALAEREPPGATHRLRIGDAARLFESVGAKERAARLFAAAGQSDAAARCLEAAGLTDELDAFLATSIDRERAVRGAALHTSALSDLLASGQPRDALHRARATDDETTRALRRDIEARAIMASGFSMTVAGSHMRVIVGCRAIVGRGSSDVRIDAPDVSREHACLQFDDTWSIVPSGDALVRIGGLRVDGPVPLRLPMRVAIGLHAELLASSAAFGAHAIEIAIENRRTLIVPGELEVGTEGLRFGRGEDGWLELVSPTPVYLSGMRLTPGATFLSGDALCTHPGAPPFVRFGLPGDQTP